MHYQVKVFDATGNLTKVITPDELERRQIMALNSMLSKRDREQIIYFDNEFADCEQTSYYRAG